VAFNLSGTPGTPGTPFFEGYRVFNPHHPVALGAFSEQQRGSPKHSYTSPRCPDSSLRNCAPPDHPFAFDPTSNLHSFLPAIASNLTNTR
jgi:hypothetical protein